MEDTATPREQTELPVGQVCEQSVHRVAFEQTPGTHTPEHGRVSPNRFTRNLILLEFERHAANSTSYCLCREAFSVQLPASGSAESAI